MMDKADRLLWGYMIKHGVLGEWSYYGARFCVNEELQQSFLKDLSTGTVDWGKTKPVVSDQVSAFTDTFHDPEYVEVLTGTLIFKNGHKYKFGTTANALDVMKAMINNIIIEE